MVNERWGYPRYRTRVDVIVSPVFDNIESGLPRLQCNPHFAAGAVRIELQTGRAHPPLQHGIANPPSHRIIAYTTDQQRLTAKCLKMPGNVERGTAENTAAVLEAIEQHFAEYRWKLGHQISHLSLFGE